MMEKVSYERVRGLPGVNISDGFRGVKTPVSKSLESVDNNSSICGSSWRQFVGPRRLLGKVGHRLGVWRESCSQPGRYCQIPNVCWKCLVGAWIGWDKSQYWSGGCCGGKKLLTQDQRLLEIFGPIPMYVGEVWLGHVLVHYIWLVLTSVENVDAQIKVLGRATTLRLHRWPEGRLKDLV